MNEPMLEELMKYWDKAWSLVEGCTPVSPACDRCWLAQDSYMRQFNPNEKISKANIGLTMKKVGGPANFSSLVRIREDRLDIPLKTKKPTVFAIWSDLFHEKVPDEFIIKAFDSMATDILQPCKHTYLVLTKRPERMAAFFERYTTQGTKPWPNVYLGTTVENQQTADERIPHLLKVQGKRFLSVEPMLGPIDLAYSCFNGADSFGKMPGISTVICGCESGTGARPTKQEWTEDLEEQCYRAGVTFWLKQYRDAQGVMFKAQSDKALPWRNGK